MGALEEWILTNRLRLSPLKTHFILAGTRQQLVKLDLADIAADLPRSP